RPRTERPSGRAVEADEEQRPVQGDERRGRAGGERARRYEVGAGDTEQVAEEQAPEPGRRGGRERDEDADAEQAGHDDRHRGVAAEQRRSPDNRDADGGAEDADGSPGEQREPEQGGTDEAREERVRERLGA